MEVIYVDQPAPGAVDILAGRDGYFDPLLSRIYVRLDVEPYLERNASRSPIAEFVSSIVPAALEHEYFHYLFYRPDVARSLFILEGEATANGERIHQTLIAGATMTTDKTDRLRQLVDKLEHGRERLSDSEMDEYERLSDALLSKEPLTRVQCQSLRAVYQEHVVNGRPLKLRSSLIAGATEFNNEYAVLHYAQAWAVYHVNALEKHSWETDIESAYHHLSAGQPLTSKEEAELTAIERETLSWVASQSRSGISGCSQ